VGAGEAGSQREGAPERLNRGGCAIASWGARQKGNGKEVMNVNEASPFSLPIFLSRSRAKHLHPWSGPSDTWVGNHWALQPTLMTDDQLSPVYITPKPSSLVSQLPEMIHHVSPGLEMIAEAKITTQFHLPQLLSGIIIGVLCYPEMCFGSFSGDVFQSRNGSLHRPACLIENNHPGVRLCQVTLKFGVPYPRVR
jgi:hypothetical protein